MEKIILSVDGMSCSHCENAIKNAVNTLDGVHEVLVNLTEKTVVVDFDNTKVTIDHIKKEIEDQGYTLRN